MSKYIEYTENHNEELNTGAVVIDFYAPWCGPCRMMSPIVDKLAEEFEGKAKVFKVNTDEFSDLSVKYGVRSIPCFIFLKNGEVKETQVGASSQQIISAKINNLL